MVARNSSFSYKGRSVDLRTVARELGVRYVLEGSVRRSGDQIRINAQLVNGSSGGHLWAERFDGTMADVFALQDDVNRKIVAALEAAQRTIEVHPNYVDGYATLAFISSYSGTFENGLEAVDQAMRINPWGTGIYLSVKGRIFLIWEDTTKPYRYSRKASLAIQLLIAHI